MNVDRRDGDLETSAKTQEKPSNIELPGLGSCHQQSPANEETHDREGEQ